MKPPGSTDSAPKTFSPGTTGQRHCRCGHPNHARHRLSRTGNRQLNAALHRIALTQARGHPDARALLDRRKAGGLEALRILKRRLSDIVHCAMIVFHQLALAVQRRISFGSERRAVADIKRLDTELHRLSDRPCLSASWLPTCERFKMLVPVAGPTPGRCALDYSGRFALPHRCMLWPGIHTRANRLVGIGRLSLRPVSQPHMYPPPVPRPANHTTALISMLLDAVSDNDPLDFDAVPGTLDQSQPH